MCRESRSRARGWRFVAACVLLGTTWTLQAAEAPLAATACDPVTGEPIYSRSTSRSFRDGRLVSSEDRYLDARGQTIATRSNRYDDQGRPLEVLLELPARSIRRGLKEFSDRLLLWDDPVDGGRPHESYLRPGSPLLTEGTIELYVLEQLDALAAGEKRRARYVSMASLRSGTLRFQRQDAEAASDGTIAIEVSGSSSRLLPGKRGRFRIDAESGRLIDYLGASDLPDADGEAFGVLLRYE